MGFERYRVDTGKAKRLTAAEVFWANVLRLRRYRIVLRTGEYMRGIPVWMPSIPDKAEPAENAHFMFHGDDDSVYLIPFADLDKYEAE